MSANKKRGDAVLHDTAPPMAQPRLERDRSQDTCADRQLSDVAPSAAAQLRIDTDVELAAHTLMDSDVLPLKVLPVDERKEPLIRRGFHSASDDHQEVKRWFWRWPDANLAVAVPDGVLVIDVDLDKPAAAQTMTGLERTLGPLPATRTVRTPKGGLHYYFSVPPEIRFKGIAGPGVDLRAGGRHYVLVPPSRIGTRRYEYLDGSDEWTPAAELPVSWIAGLEHQRPRLRTTRHGVLPAALSGLSAIELETVTLEDLSAYLDELPGGAMDAAMLRAVEPVELARAMQQSAHDTLRGRSYRVIALAAEGHPGGRDAVQRIMHAFVAEMNRRIHAGEPARAVEEVGGELVRAVGGAIVKVAAL